MGKHTKRARLYDAEGIFVAAIGTEQAQRLLDFGYVYRVGRSLPLRIQLRAKKQRPLIPKKPTSGCTGSAAITARDSEANAGNKYLRRTVAMLILLARGWAERDIAGELNIAEEIVINSARNWPITTAVLLERRARGFGPGDVARWMQFDHEVRMNS